MRRRIQIAVEEAVQIATALEIDGMHGSESRRAEVVDRPGFADLTGAAYDQRFAARRVAPLRSCSVRSRLMETTLSPNCQKVKVLSGITCLVNQGI